MIFWAHEAQTCWKSVGICSQNFCQRFVRIEHPQSKTTKIPFGLMYVVLVLVTVWRGLGASFAQIYLGQLNLNRVIDYTPDMDTTKYYKIA